MPSIVLPVHDSPAVLRQAMDDAGASNGQGRQHELHDQVTIEQELDDVVVARFERTFLAAGDGMKAVKVSLIERWHRGVLPGRVQMLVEVDREKGSLRVL